VDALLEPLEARAAVGVEGDQLSVEYRLARAQLPHQSPDLGVLARDLVEVPRAQLQPTGTAVGDRPHAVPLDLDRPAAVLRGQLRKPGEHGDQWLRERVDTLGRRVHAMDHPVALIARAEERVAAAEALAFEAEDDLPLLPLLAQVGAAIPDPDRAGPVLAGRDLTLEVEILQRVVLRMDRLAVFAGIVGDPVGHRPGDRDAAVLEPQVPVKSTRAVFLHDEARRPTAAPPSLRRRLRGGAEVPAALVLGELSLRVPPARRQDAPRR
jgi:hypothetical protein